MILLLLGPLVLFMDQTIHMSWQPLSKIVQCKAINVYIQNLKSMVIIEVWKRI